MECLRSATTTFATSLENPAFQIIRWITSTNEGGESPNCNGTSRHGVELEGSTATEVQVVPRQAEITDLRTTLTEANMGPPESMRAQSKVEISIRPV